MGSPRSSCRELSKGMQGRESRGKIGKAVKEKLQSLQVRQHRTKRSTQTQNKRRVEDRTEVKIIGKKPRVRIDANQ